MKNPIVNAHDFGLSKSINRGVIESFRSGIVIFFVFYICIFCAAPSFSQINKENFKNPSLEYSIAPFWFLNGNLKKDEIIIQLEDMHNKGVDILIPHARSGLVQEYLSKDWFDIYEAILVTAKRLGMKVIIYDEYNWPTGKAGGFIQTHYPEFRNKNLFYNKYEIKGPNQFNVIENKGIIRHFFIAENSKEKLRFIRRDDLIKNNEIFLDVPEGSTLEMLTFVENIGDFVDLMNPKEVKQFISLTHERYYKRFKHYFGDTIIGFCFDEPIIASWPNFPLPWNDDLEKEFFKKYRYSLADNLPCLFFEASNFQKVRKDFYSLVSVKFEKSFFRQLSNWAKNHSNIFYCGHLMNDDNLYGSLQCGGDIFGLLKNIQLPGFDWVGDYKLGPITGRQLASIAELGRKKRVSCEIFGGSGWSFPAWKMKRNVDWAFLLGANMIIPHAFFYTVDGYTQLNDYPPSLFAPQPYWEVFKLFADYVRRCSYMLSNLKRVSNIALLYPMKGMIETYTPLKKDKDAESIDRDFEYICRVLFEKNLDFKIIDGDLLKRSAISEKRLIINGNNFSILIIPMLKGLEQDIKNLIEKMKRKSLKIYILNEGVDVSDQNIDGMLQDIESTLKNDKQQKEFFNASKELYWVKYQFEETLFFFISNQSKDKWGEVEFLSSDMNFNFWDPVRGDIYNAVKLKKLFIPPLYSFFLEVPVKLHGFTAVASSLAGFAQANPEPRFIGARGKNIYKDNSNFPDYLFKKPDEELLIQGEWAISIEGRDSKTVLTELKPLNNIEGFSNFSGKVIYKITFNLHSSILSQNKIYLELEDIYHAARIFLNNQKIGDVFGGPGFFDVTSLLKEDNVLELHVYNTFSNAITTMKFKKDDVIRYKYNKKDDWVSFKNEDLEYGLLKSPKILLFRK